jgi:glycosyltransferase involved in cell wall biosynthesis
LKTPLPHLVIAGPGWDTSYGRQMRQLIDNANCKFLSETCKLKTENSPRIHSVNMLKGDAKWGAFYGCEAFVLPSHQENFGISVVEALACDKFVLISNKVNIWREIQKNKSGFVADDNLKGTKMLFESFFKIQNTTSKKKIYTCSGGILFISIFKDCFRKEFKMSHFAFKLSNLIREH